jgi:hypothetical protein
MASTPDRLRWACGGCAALIVLGALASLYWDASFFVLAGLGSSYALWRWIAGWLCSECGKPVCWDYVNAGQSRVWGWTLFFSSRCSGCQADLARSASRKRDHASPGSKYGAARTPLFLVLFGGAVCALVLLTLWGRSPSGGAGDVSSFSARMGL